MTNKKNKKDYFSLENFSKEDLDAFLNNSNDDDDDDDDKNDEYDKKKRKNLEEQDEWKKFNDRYTEFIANRGDYEKMKRLQKMVNEAAEIIEQQKKRENFFRNIRSPIKKYLIKFLDPNIIVCVAGYYFVVYKQIDKIIEGQNQQQTQINRIEQHINPPFSLTRALKTNWPKIVLGSGTVLTAGKYLYGNWAETRGLRSDLDQANRRITESEANLQETESSLQEAKNNLQETKKQHGIYVEKLHSTLSTLNKNALHSADVETQYRSVIVETRNQLAEAIQERDDLIERVKDYEDSYDVRFKEQRDMELLIKSKNNEIEAKESEIIDLEADLAKERAENKRFSFKSSSYKSKLKKVKDSRDKLIKEVSKKNREFTNLRTDHEKLKNNYIEERDRKEVAEEKIEQLNIETKKYRDSLEKANKNTERFAMQMDSVTNKLGQSEETVAEKDKRLADKEKEIKLKDEQNEILRQSVSVLVSKFQQNIIEKDELQKTKEQLENTLKTASPEEQQTLKKQIKEKDKNLGELEKDNKNLKQTIINKDLALEKGYEQQKKLIKKYDDLEGKSKQQQETWLGRLRSEREEQEQRMRQATDTSQEIINNLLNKQESDQSRSWLQRFLPSISIKPELSVTQEQVKEQVTRRESYFYPPHVPYPHVKPIVEQQDNKTKKWYVVDDKNKRTRTSKFRSKERPKVPARHRR